MITRASITSYFNKQFRRSFNFLPKLSSAELKKNFFQLERKKTYTKYIWQDFKINLNTKKNITDVPARDRMEKARLEFN